MQPNRKSITATVALAAVLALATAWPCAAGTVNSLLDDGSQGTLRYELVNASPGDTINITAVGTIYLDQTAGPLMVDKSVNITGPGQDQLTIDGGGGTAVFVVGMDMITGPIPDVTAAISGLTIANGTFEVGGGVVNCGTLTLTDCTLSGNYAYGPGGAIFNIGALTLTDCTLSDNVSGFMGGAICNGMPMTRGYGGTLTLTHCSLSDNSVEPNAPGGGAIVNYGYGASASVTIEDSTLSGNSAPQAGAIATVSFEDHAAATDTTPAQDYPARATVKS